MVLDVRVDHESGQIFIILSLDFVSNHGKDVKSGQDRISKVHIVIEVDIWLVHSTNGIGSGYH